MKILSLNLQITDAHIDQVAMFLDTHDVDHVFFQEVLVEGGTDIAQKINDSLQNPYLSISTAVVEDYTTSSGDTYTQGMAILSRADEITTHVLELEGVETDKHKRIAQFASIRYNCKGCLPEHIHEIEEHDFVNVHFANKTGNENQLKQVLDYADEDFTYPIIVGDFNMSKNGFYPTKRYWGKAYKSSVEFANYISYPGSGEFSQIDICLIPRHMDFDTITTYEGMSDHNGVEYSINFDNEHSYDNYIGYIHPNNSAIHKKYTNGGGK